MYDYTHCISDSIERITHSICTLEFEDHRPLYDWVLDVLNLYHPQQIEFARLNVTYILLSKRKLLELVQQNIVNGWDDPRMPTICGLRRRGFTPESIRTFAELIGVAKRESMVDYALLDFCIREDLNKSANRVMGVLRPLKVIIDNYPEDMVDELTAVNNPEDESAGTRTVPFSREIYIEQDDFMENPPKKYFRLSIGAEVRLRYGYYIKCVSATKDENGNITELHCTYDPETRGGQSPDGRRVKGTIHWVSAKHAFKAEVRLYDHLFSRENMNELEEGKDYKDYLNPSSLEVVQGLLEPSLAEAKIGDKFQFERLGYFCVDSKDSKPSAPIFNRTTTLRDTWAKIAVK
jgi:glutaminyl-tRNA synthetase